LLIVILQKDGMSTKPAWSGALHALSMQAIFVAILVTVSSPAKASPNLVVNGSFDDTGTVQGGFYSDSPASNLPGWTINSNSSQIDCVVPGNAFGGGAQQICGPYTGHSQTSPKFTLWTAPGPSPAGGNYFLMDGDTNFESALTQQLNNLVIGGQYRLSFYQASGQEDCLVDDGSNCDPAGGGNLTQRWQVKFGSATQNSTLMTTAPHGSVGWNSQVLTFTATAATQTLSFLAVGTPNGAPPLVFLDGVTLTAVPEPATSALLGLGLLILPFSRKLLQKSP
jgi:hypothetical protein